MAYENISAGVLGPTPLSGAPVAGTTEVQTLTIGGTPTGGTFTLALDGLQTAPIAWSATNATLLANIQAALDARFGTNQIVAALGTITAGIGTITLTFSGASYVRRAVNTMTVTNSLTGTTPTLAMAETTPGVNASPAYAPIGSVWVRTDNGTMYVATAVGTLTAQV